MRAGHPNLDAPTAHNVHPAGSSLEVEGAEVIREA